MKTSHPFSRLFPRACTAFLLAAGMIFSAAHAAPFTAPTAHDPANPAMEPAVAAIAKVMPAVVNINTERLVRKALRDPYEEFINQFFGEQARSPRRELRQKVQSLGSGFLIDATGYIVTNEHVVERADNLKIQVTTADGATYDARYIVGDPSADLALLKIESPAPLPFIPLADLSPNLLGQSVLVVGNPLGYGHSVARGILSATNRSLSLDNTAYENLLQTDAAINPGNSGGPLIDLAGRLVGVASAKMAYSPQGVPTQGIGFAIPGRVVAEKLAEFQRLAQEDAADTHPRAKAAREAQRAAKTTRQRLGLSFQALTPKRAEELGVPAGGGVLIAEVDPESPAAKGGLRPGLVVYKVGNYEVNSPAEAEALLQTARRGTPVDISVGVTRQIGPHTLLQIQTVNLLAR